MDAINTVLCETLTCETEEASAQVCLRIAQKLTGSPFGFIGEVNAAGHLHIIALSDPAREGRPIPAAKKPAFIENAEVRGIWSRVMTTGESQVRNDAPSDADCADVPEGCPPFTSVLGVPLKRGRETLGVFALVNKDSGYNSADQQLVESLSGALVSTLLRQRAEAALRESEARYKLLVEHSPDAILVHADGVLVFANPVAVQMLGADNSQSLIGRPYLDIVHPDYHGIVKARAQQILQGGAPVPKIQEHFIRLDGKSVDVEVSTLPFAYQGKPAVQVVAQDVSQRKRLEAQLRQAQKMEAIGQLAGGVAHDFNNVLQGIIGYAQLIQQEIPSENRCCRDVEKILESARGAAQLTQKLLTLSRQQVLNPTDLDLNELLSDLMKMLGRVLGEHIEIDFIPGYRLGTIHADRNQLEQVVMNLCVNARDAMPNGGKITVETENILLDGGYCEAHPWAKPGRYVLLSISDTGCGMSEEALEHVFEPFFTTKGPGRGTGLGLATVYGIVKQHDGLIHVYSESGHGTTFKIYLPSVERRAAVLPLKVERPVRGGTETILVVEDDAVVREFTTRVLAEAGYTILQAANGGEALRILRDDAQNIALVLLDVVLPKMSGREVYNRIKEISPQVRALFSSGYPINGSHTGFIPAQGLELIQKPYATQTLLRKVREVLDAET